MIEGKVAAIVNSRELAINRGTDQGVLVGMRFEVLDTTAGEITDPDTNERLGHIMGVKVRVEVVEVERLYSVAQTYETLGGNTSLASLLKFESPRPQTLKTDDALFTPLSEGGSYVKRGDLVRELEEEGS